MVTIGNMFNNLNNGTAVNNGGANLINQFQQCQKNPGAILDILAQSGRINQQQYQELQPYKNNPEQIAKYLMGQNQGFANQINQIVQQLNQTQQ